MSTLNIIREVHRHSRLSAIRNPMWDKSHGIRFFMAIVWALAVVYIACFGVMLAYLVRKDGSVSAYEFIAGVLPFVLLADFLLRLAIKQTPTQLVKPYLLLPISKYTVTDSFLLEDLLSPINLIWQALFIPYGVLTILTTDGIFAFLGFIIILQLIVEINSQWYLLIRSLTSVSVLWWAFPVLVCAIVLLPSFVGNETGVAAFCDFYAQAGGWLWKNQTVLWSSTVIVLLLIFLLNRLVEHNLLRREVSDSRNTATSRLLFGKGVSFLSSANNITMYMKLDIVSIARNKNLRKTFISAILLLAVISAVMSLTSIFVDDFMKTFWLVYSFDLFAAMFLVKIMSYEGNYIECLAVGKDSITSLLWAKYFLSVAVLIIPFVILIPTVVAGVYSVSDLIAYMLLAAGVVNFGYFQLAPYNNETTALNAKLMGKGRTQNNYTQIVVSAIVFAVPVSVIMMLENKFGHDITNIVIAIVGIVFTLASYLWIPNIAKSMRKRKYGNLESYRQTRMSIS